MEDEASNHLSLSSPHSPPKPDRGLVLQDFLNPNPAGAGDLGPAPAPCFPTCHPASRFDSSFLNSFPMNQIGNSEEINRSGDRRYTRMMKNRESAARSRNRKMAYTLELERKKTRLMEENARLKKELRKQEPVIAALGATEVEARKKPNLSKSMFALF